MKNKIKNRTVFNKNDVYFPLNKWSFNANNFGSFINFLEKWH